MTPEELKYAASVMLAAAEGKKIQYRSKGEIHEQWGETRPSWNWDLFDYRIAPEPRKPREWKVWEPESLEQVLEISNFALGIHSPDKKRKVIRVREVLPEES